MSEVTESQSLISGLEATYKPPKRVVDQTLDKDDFLELLLVQMRNQDPMKPQDQTESIAQLAQFSSLEQMTNLNDGMDKLLNAYNQSSRSSAFSLIGKEVEGFRLSEDSEGNTTQETVKGIVSGVDLTTETPSIVITTEEGGTAKIPQVQLRTVTEVQPPEPVEEDPTDIIEDIAEALAGGSLNQEEEESQEEDELLSAEELQDILAQVQG